ncbi:F0F1 ATP synthase subunit delta [Knoellia subterranea]|uniref:ATP synthase subunit delta n=1 Tax=Knoellia subterranea KCTC 19937 TaxID=1385521 RepID=A0A0A0JTB2_9MICO|nr:F0F1 ATP synthase subunit delta [Knoellia subterranea]KGN39317.1 ATP synthase subunit delta [Knoellia subterranea KCTC 19937]
MAGSSRGARAAADKALALALDGVDRGALAEELFAIAGTIEGDASLRRAFADPSREGEAKRGLADRIFGGKVSESANTLMGEVVAQRWSSEGDFGDTLESLAVRALLANAEKAERVDTVEDELFRFERIIAADAELRDTLSSRNTDAEGKAGVVRKLLEGKAQPETIRLAERAVLVPRGRRLDRVLESYLKLATERRDELKALVTTAVPLDERQQSRLASALRSIYGKKVTLQIVLDKGIVGGIRVQVGDEVVDGTVVRRLDTVRRDLAG